MSPRRSACALVGALATVAAGALGSLPVPGAAAAPATATWSTRAIRSATPSSQRPTHLAWHITATSTTEEYRGLAAVSRRVAWVSGEAGSVLRTTNRGASWKEVSPPDAKGLALRDIEAWSRQRAFVLSIGPGTDSRIYSTDNGGTTWTERFRNHQPAAFYDCMAFSANGRGLALSDPVNGHFRLAASNNFGRSWRVLSTAGMPPAEDGEFAFAASGTCIVAIRAHAFAFVTGGVDASRVFRSHNGGRTWTATTTPMRGGSSAGIYSADFRTPTWGVIVGGDYTHERNGRAASAYVHHSRRSWTLSDRFVHGYRSGVSFVSGTRSTVVAVGPTGSDVSRDGGRTWTRFDGTSYDAVQCVRRSACWASGTDGRVARLVPGFVLADAADLGLLSRPPEVPSSRAGATGYATVPPN